MKKHSGHYVQKVIFNNATYFYIVILNRGLLIIVTLLLLLLLMVDFWTFSTNNVSFQDSFLAREIV